MKTKVFQKTFSLPCCSKSHVNIPNISLSFQCFTRRMSRSRSPSQTADVYRGRDSVHSINNKRDINSLTHGIISNFLPFFVNSRCIVYADLLALIAIIQNPYMEHLEDHEHRHWFRILQPPFINDWFTIWYLFSKSLNKWTIHIIDERQFLLGFRPTLH